MKTTRDKDYLLYIRTQPCAFCTMPPNDNTQIVYHHEQLGDSGGYGLKSSDHFAVPLCNDCHLIIHMAGKESFWEGFDVQRIIIDLLSKHISTRCVEGR